MQSQTQLELSWHKRVSQARERYVFKAKLCNLLLAELTETFPKILRSDPDSTLARHQVLQREFEALQEYMRVLRIYTGLVTQGKVPLEDPC